ncbi:MAG: hypothetical protein AAB887_00210 [Patescibacteria group bacterium]
MQREHSIFTSLKTFIIFSGGFLTLAERLFREPQLAIPSSFSDTAGGLVFGISAGVIYNVLEGKSKKAALYLALAAAVLPTVVLAGHEILGYSIFGIGNGGDGLHEVLPLIICLAAGLYATSRQNFHG